MELLNKDLVILGSGPGGYVAAIKASQLGRKVTIVEKDALGGICLNWGCIPSKALLRSAQIYHDLNRSKEFGFETGPVKIDFPSIVERSRQVAGKLSAGVTYLMKKNNIEVIKGYGTLEKNNTLKVSNESGTQSKITFKDIIIATGASARPLPGVEIDGDIFHNYRTLLENTRMPQKLLIVGGGAIGIEFGYFFTSLGVQVTLVEMLPQILPPEDTEIAKELEKSLTKKGMRILTNTKVENIQKSGKTASAKIITQTDEEIWTGDACLFAIGFVPNSNNLGFEEIGLELDRGFIKVDNFLRTNLAHHFAIGDITGPPQLAHKASHEALIAAAAACGDLKHPMEYDNIPGCTYCQPQVASVGLTERAAKEKGLNYSIGKIPFAAIGKAIAIGESEGFTKVITEKDTGEILGVHIIHAEATELISEAAIARSHEATSESITDTIHPHPTLSESIAEAMAIAQGKPINF